MASNSMEALENHAIQQMIRNSLALQQTLSSITATREHQLDHARKYYEMLYMEPEDIIKDITEKGPKYTELQVSFGCIIYTEQCNLPRITILKRNFFNLNPKI